MAEQRDSLTAQRLTAQGPMADSVNGSRAHATAGGLDNSTAQLAY
jgi:hypothetical protein